MDNGGFRCECTYHYLGSRCETRLDSVIIAAVVIVICFLVVLLFSLLMAFVRRYYMVRPRRMRGIVFREKSIPDFENEDTMEKVPESSIMT